ncbi:MAG TPA: arginine--tRNA ligase [Actinomycetota bacterium]|nr:arginine--tRNA ligase [Actinomycetota bacterium]
MIEAELVRLIRTAVEATAAELALDGPAPEIEILRPRQKEHGDYATGVALALAAGAGGRNPRAIAEALLRHLPPADFVDRAEVAGPGFINFFVTHGWLHGVVEQVRRLGGDYGRVDVGAGERVLVEFVSANPTGPLHVGTGRNAAVGDALARVLAFAGYEVSREYYVNDAGSQMELFGASVEARYLEHFGRPAEVPERGYHGAYVRELAAAIAQDLGDEPLDMPAPERRRKLAEEGMARALEGIRGTLERFGVRFDTWFRESTLHETGRVQQALELLRERDLAYEAEGALWFRAERFGDDKDRVLVRASGDPTYFAADTAYLRDKFARGFDHLIYVWGADHHGTVKRLEGAATAFGYEVDRVEFILTQLVSLYRDAEPVRMSKRTGDIVTLDELVEEVGPDAARYTLLTRSVDSALDFDIEHVKRRSLDNPVYYVQYAHARIASVIRFAREQGVELGEEEAPADLLTHETELDLMRKIAELPSLIRLVADGRAPHRLTRYAEEVAAGFHRFYTACRVVTEDADLTRARLHLAAATRQVIANVLGLLGVSAPESMERLGEEDEA